MGLTANYIAKPIYLKTDQFLYHDSFFKQFFYITCCGTFFRCRLHIAFVLSTWSCKGLGLGAYPKDSKPKPFSGPSDPNYSWNNVNSSKDISYICCFNDFEYFRFITIINTNVFENEFSTTYANALRNWNITVQCWLANYIYKGLKYKRRSIGLFIFSLKL